MNLPIDYTSLDWMQRREVRNQYVKIQNGICSHCGGELNKNAAAYILKKKVNEKLFPANFFKYPIHLHHNHINKMTIGAVHNYCNAVLWQYHGE